MQCSVDPPEISSKYLRETFCRISVPSYSQICALLSESLAAIQDSAKSELIIASTVGTIITATTFSTASLFQDQVTVLSRPPGIESFDTGIVGV